MSLPKKKSVLVPIDFSEISYSAIAPASEYVEDPSSLKIIHVLSPLHPADPAAMWNTLSDTDRMNKVKEFLHDKLKEMGYEKLKIKVAIGNPSAEIVKYAKETETDLIVMPSHGHKGISQILLGSVAERVVRLSSCPVLILK